MNNVKFDAIIEYGSYGQEEELLEDVVVEPQYEECHQTILRVGPERTICIESPEGSVGSAYSTIKGWVKLEKGREIYVPVFVYLYVRGTDSWKRFERAKAAPQNDPESK